MNCYTQIKVTAPMEYAEQATAVMTALPFLGGLMVEDYSDIEGVAWDYIDETLLAADRETVFVSGYVAAGEEVLPFLEQLQLLLPPACTVAVLPVSEEDWANNWKQYYRPIQVGKHLVIKPSWEQYECRPGDVVVELDPGMAFGTGTHETTRMCMELLERYVTKDKTVLDVGCGSGILSIAALLLGAKSALGVDIDPVAAKVAAENGARNGLVPPRFTVVHGDLLQQVHDTYPLVVANIIADIIIPLCGDVKSLLEPGGMFICSGIIDSRADDVEQALLQQGYRIVDRKTEGEWLAFCAVLEETKTMPA